MKKHLSDFLHLFVLPLGSMIVGAAILVLPLLYALEGCQEDKPKEKDWIYINYGTDLSEFKGKTISQMFPGDGNQVTIVFTDTTRVTISTTNCSLKLYK